MARPFDIERAIDTLPDKSQEKEGIDMHLIVVMEDDAGTRMLVASVLKKDGYDVL